MKPEKKKAAYERLGQRLSTAGMVTPVLAEGQPEQLDTVRDIETITGEILEAKRVGGEAVLTIGRGLIEAKAMLEHGEWLPWLTERVEFSERTAQNFMRLAREWSNPQTLADLGASKALALLALPAPEREGFLSGTHIVNGEEKMVIDMTSREVEKAIRERDEARQAAEQAKVDAASAAEARASMEESLKAANELASRAQEEKEKAEGTIAALEERLAELKAAPVDVAVMEVDQEALEKARAEGAASKAEELAKLQAQLDKAQAAEKKAEEKRKGAEAAAENLKLQLEAASKVQAQTAARSDPDMAKFEVYFNQVKEAVNKMRGLLLEARSRDDQTAAEKLGKSILALSEAMKGAAQ